MATRLHTRSKAVSHALNLTERKVDPQAVDIRLAAGTPPSNPDQPIKLICPKHLSRIGQEDDTGSLAVYDHNIHCFGCQYHIKRRYAALAFLLGLWDGEGDEDGDEVRQIVRKMRPRIGEFLGKPNKLDNKFVPPPISVYDVEAFHQYMLRYARGRMEAELIRRRGLSMETIRRFKLGYTGTHFTIPVPNLDNGFYTLRYRADDGVLDAHEPGSRKYEGTWGRNLPYLFPLSCIRELSAAKEKEQESGSQRCRIDELWVTEGEFDALSVIQSGDVALTVTNGATNAVKVVEMVRVLGIRVGRWVVATDQDAAGEQAAQKIIAQTNGVRARWGVGKDLTEFYSQGGRRQDIWFGRS